MESIPQRFWAICAAHQLPVANPRLNVYPVNGGQFVAIVKPGEHDTVTGGERA